MQYKLISDGGAGGAVQPMELVIYFKIFPKGVQCNWGAHYGVC